MAENEIDYEESGLKCGLEVHQQLDTGKLFCNCPSLLRKDEPDFTIKRKLHAVAGQSGEVDAAALHEASLGKQFVYEGYNGTTCLVELDEEPPHMINQGALKIAIQISFMLNCKILPISQIMRKTVIDGSNTSGFQRTVLIARDGFVETASGRVGIQSVCLEEDSARIVQKEEGKGVSVYRLDRLGIPLIEIATEPEIKSPNQAKEVALHIGEILRSCRVKRGLGTIRQDVNLSTKEHPRVEIKGFQDIRNIEKAIEKEVLRQKNSEKKERKSQVRRVMPDGSSRFLRPMPGAARMYPETDLPILKISRKMIDESKKSIPKEGDNKTELEKKGLNEHMIRLLFKQGKVEEFKELLNVINNPKLIAKTLLIYPTEIASREKKPFSKVEKILNKDVISSLLERVKKGDVSEHEVKQVLENVVRYGNYEKAIKKEKGLNKNILEEKISNLIKSKPGLSMNAYMGLVMKGSGLRGKISGKEAIEIIRKYLKS